MIRNSIMKELTDASVLPLSFFCYIFITAVIEKEVQIMVTKKSEAKNKHHVTQKFNKAIHKEIIENKWLSD